MKALQTVLLLTLSLVLATGAVAEDKAKGEKGKAGAAKKQEGAKGKEGARRGEGRKAPSISARFLGKIELSPEQKEKVAAIDKEFGAKAAEIRKAQAGILTKEQIAARQAAMKKAKESKDRSPEARKAIQDAVKLSDDQKAKMADVQKQQKELGQKVLAALKNILTEEQQKNLPAMRRGGKGKGEGAQKPAGDRRKKGDAAKKGEGAKKKEAAK